MSEVDEVKTALAIADELQGNVEILAEAIANAIHDHAFDGNKELIHDTIIRRLRRLLSNDITHP